jgi:hypothetical protein
MAETGRAAKGRTKGGSASRPRKKAASTQPKTARSAQTQSTRARSSGGRSSTARRPSASRNGLSAADAVLRARAALSELLGRRVESVLGIERDHNNWVATVQVVEMARIPNTTDVLGDYETVLDNKGDVLRYHRTRRYHRGQVDGSQQ